VCVVGGGVADWCLSLPVSQFLGLFYVSLINSYSVSVDPEIKASLSVSSG
jgi:hypothetical protein